MIFDEFRIPGWLYLYKGNYAGLLDRTKTLICNAGRRCYYFIYAQNGSNRGSSRRSSLQVMVTLNSMAPVIVGNFSSLMVWRQVNCKHPQRSGTDIRKPDLWLSLTSLNVKALWVGRSWRMLQTGFNFKKHMVKLASTSPKGTSKYRAPRIHWRSFRVGFRCPAHDFRYLT